MTTPSEVPRYRLLTDAFFAPKLVLAGSVVATFAPPGPHMQPLNEAAEARMEEWYNEEHPTLDKQTGEPNYEKMWKPHMIHKIRASEPGESYTFEVLAEPPRDQTGELSLAESIYTRKDTDQRPGPAVVFKAPDADAMAEQSGAAVVEEVTKPADPRKAGIKVS